MGFGPRKFFGLLTPALAGDLPGQIGPRRPQASPGDPSLWGTPCVPKRDADALVSDTATPDHVALSPLSRHCLCTFQYKYARLRGGCHAPRMHRPRNGSPLDRPHTSSQPTRTHSLSCRGAKLDAMHLAPSACACWYLYLARDKRRTTVCLDDASIRKWYEHQGCSTRLHKIYSTLNSPRSGSFDSRGCPSSVRT